MTVFALLCPAIASTISSSHITLSGNAKAFLCLVMFWLLIRSIKKVLSRMIIHFSSIASIILSASSSDMCSISLRLTVLDAIFMYNFQGQINIIALLRLFTHSTPHKENLKV